MALKYDIAEDIGNRESMEDRYFVTNITPNITWYAVLDGHGGKGAVRFFKRKLPKVFKTELETHTTRKAVRATFRILDEKWYKRHRSSGTTITSVLVTPKRIYTINLGDSRTLVRLHNRIVCTVDHNPKDKKEAKRIREAGWEIYIDHSGIHRIEGYIAVTRALGDRNFKHKLYSTPYSYKEGAISASPDIVKYNRDEVVDLVLASGGLWDRLTTDDVVDSILNEKPDAHDLLTQAKGRYTDNKYQRKKGMALDNIMVMTIMNINPPAEYSWYPLIS
jgi:serine/threonine protein phosphatase PrpC